MRKPRKLVMAKLGDYGQVELLEVEAKGRDGFAQYEVLVRDGAQVFHYYLNHQGGAWVPQIDSANATVAFGDTAPRAARALRAQRLAVAERMDRDLARFREVTAEMGVG